MNRFAGGVRERERAQTDEVVAVGKETSFGWLGIMS